MCKGVALERPTNSTARPSARRADGTAWCELCRLSSTLTTCMTRHTWALQARHLYSTTARMPLAGVRPRPTSQRRRALRLSPVAAGLAYLPPRTPHPLQLITHAAHSVGAHDSARRAQKPPPWVALRHARSGASRRANATRALPLAPHAFLTRGHQGSRPWCCGTGRPCCLACA